MAKKTSDPFDFSEFGVGRAARTPPGQTPPTGQAPGRPSNRGFDTGFDPFAGWLLAGPVAIGVLAEFSRIDIRRRTHAVYSAPRWVPNVYWAILGVCLLGIAVGAWHIALWAGTL